MYIENFMVNPRFSSILIKTSSFELPTREKSFELPTREKYFFLGSCVTSPVLIWYHIHREFQCASFGEGFKRIQ